MPRRCATRGAARWMRPLGGRRSCPGGVGGSQVTRNRSADHNCYRRSSVRMKLVPMVALALATLAQGVHAQAANAASRGGEATYEGKTVSAWQAQLRDNVPE